MRTLKGLPIPIPHNEDYAKFKQGTVKNETDTEPGTPVIEELYGDIITNLYKLLEVTGITPTQTQDSETTQFQLVEALQKVFNNITDIEQIISLTGTEWSIPFEIDNLPNKFVFVARAADGYTSGVSYTFKGTDTNIYTLTSPSGFDASDEVLCIVDQSGVRVYSLSFLSTQSNEVFTVFGNPLAFNDTSNLYYESNGNLFNDTPSIHYLQAIIRASEADGTLLIYDTIILKGYVLCLVFYPSTTSYKFFQFDLNNLLVAIEVSLTGVTIPTGVDRLPYLYTDGEFLFLTNSSGNVDDDFELDKLSYTPSTPTIDYIEDITLEATFYKTTNVVIENGSLITFINGVLKKYLLSTGIESTVGDFNTLNGIIFNFNNQVYYTNGEVAKKWVV